MPHSARVHISQLLAVLTLAAMLAAVFSTFTKAVPVAQAAQDQWLYQDGALVNPWANHASYSGTQEYASTEQVSSGSSSLKAVYKGWGFLNFRYGSYWTTSTLYPADYASLDFSIRSAGTTLTVQVGLGVRSSGGGSTTLGSKVYNLTADSWQVVSIPLSEINSTGAVFNDVGFYIYQGPGTQDFTFYLDNLRLVGSTVGTDTTPPSVVLTAPTNDAAVSGVTTISANAVDSVGVARVDFDVAGTVVGSDTTSPYTYAWDTTGLVGSRTIVARAYDAAGNSGTSPAVQVTIGSIPPPTTDTTPPSVSLTAPLSSSTVSGAAVTVSATASDNVGVVGVQFKLDGTNLGSEDVQAPYALTWDTVATTNGSHTLTAVARDAAGNLSTSVAVVVTVSNSGSTPPSGSGNLKVLGYYTVWSVCDMPPAQLDYNALTHIVHFNSQPRLSYPYYSLSLSETDKSNLEYGAPGWCDSRTRGVPEGWQQQMINLGHAKGVKTVLSLGGEWGNNAQIMDQVVSNTAGPDSMRTFVDQALTYAKNRNYDGVEINWEFPGASSGGRSTKAQISAFLTYLRQGIDARWGAGNGTLVVTVGSYVNNLYDMAVLNATADVVPVMNYGMGAASYSGFNAPIYRPTAYPNYNADYITKSTGFANQGWVNAGVAKDKVLLLMSFEDIRWTGVTEPGQSGGSAGSWISYWNALQQRLNSANNYHWDDVAKASWIGGSVPFQTFEDTRSIQEKVAYVRSIGIGGIGAYDLWRGWLPSNLSDPDQPGKRDPLLQALKQAVAGTTVTPPTTDTTPPSVSLTAPLSSSTVSGAAVTVSATASDNVGVVGVQFKLDGTNLGSEDVQAPYALTWDTVATTNGSHTLTAVARDAAGNQTVSNSIAVTVVNTTTSPPTGGSSGGGGGGGSGGGGGFSSGVVINTPPIAAPLTPPASPTPVPADEPVTTLHGASSAVVETVSGEEARAVQSTGGLAALSTTETALYQRLVASAGQVSDQTRFSISLFIRDGSPTTVTLGAGERAGVVNSFRTAFGRLPGSEADWREVIKIANGRWPSILNPAREKAVEATFQKVYLRAPRTTSANDRAAIAIMAYGLRSARRNLASERAALSIFRAIIGRTPVTAADWDVVRAIAYSGAKR